MVNLLIIFNDFCVDIVDLLDMSFIVRFEIINTLLEHTSQLLHSLLVFHFEILLHPFKVLSVDLVQLSALHLSYSFMWFLILILNNFG